MWEQKPSFRNKRTALLGMKKFFSKSHEMVCKMAAQRSGLKLDAYMFQNNSAVNYILYCTEDSWKDACVGIHMVPGVECLW